MATLLEIGEELRAFMALVDEEVTADGELSPEAAAQLEAWFAEIGDQQTAKVDSYCQVIRDQTLQASVLTEELERLKRRQEARENVAKRMKDRLKIYMEVTGQKKIECKRFTAAIQNNGGIVPMEMLATANDLPDELCKKLPDNEKIREALEAGKTVEKCKLLPRGQHLRIR